jgi:DNA invertase Pin-like site-specific DNA recombinase
MRTNVAKTVHCAIYTRVSTEQGLGQDFNSLDAQYEASRAYIRSQAHDGWSQVRTRYDDGGYSGGSTDRPALQRLLADVRARKVDVIVVYKVDRLTRSLADFAKLVELFDAHNASFVSVTQQFNTTTSMGRLTLNVLLSFAQFEREVTSERIRDKIAASKRKGLWVGGKLPLGYAIKDRKVVGLKKEAQRVRLIFRTYLRLGSLDRVLSDLRERGVVTKVQTLEKGKTIGGIPFARGALSHLLRNRFYIGEVVYKGEILPGEQPPILERKLFEAVQAKLTQQQNNPTRTRGKSESLLIGKIFDDRNNRMGPSHTRKNGLRYRYYVSLPLVQGQKSKAGSVDRVPATEIETVVAAAVRRACKSARQMDDRPVLKNCVTRVEVRQRQLVITIKRAAGDKVQSKVLHIPWKKPPSKRRREIIVPKSASSNSTRPIRTDARARLLTAIARGRLWLNELANGSIANIEALASRECCTTRKINMTISLAFLAPDLVKAAIDGRLPRGIGLARLYDPPVAWVEQYQKLGLPEPN